MLAIGYENFNGIDVTTVTDQNVEFFRAYAAFPFDGTPYRDCLPAEIPHMFEHVAAGYDRTLQHRAYTSLLERSGGYANAHTAYKIHGCVSFEIAQPEDEPSTVQRYLRNVFTTKPDTSSVETQRAIVANELTGKVSNRQAVRSAQRTYDLGLTYKTDVLGLESLSTISQADVEAFQTQAVCRPNVRLVLSGNHAAVTKFFSKLEPLFANLPNAGERKYTDDSLRPLPDYHCSASDIPEGTTDYWFCQMSTSPLAPSVPRVEFAVIADAVRHYLNSGSAGLAMASRHLGLSYGLTANFLYDEASVGVAMRDIVRAENVKPQIDLLRTRLTAAKTYKARQFDSFRKMMIGVQKINPENIDMTIKGIEAVITSRNMQHSELFTRSNYRKALESMNAEFAASCVTAIADQLLRSTTVSKYSYGTNPFISFEDI